MAKSVRRGKAREMKLDDLLLWWAEWSAKREDGGLGFGVSRVNFWMSGGVVVGNTGGTANLPYGVDVDSIASVMDRAICKLSTRRREILMVEYREIGTQAAKAAGLKRPVSLDTYKRILRNARWNLEADADVKRLLKTC